MFILAFAYGSIVFFSDVAVAKFLNEIVLKGVTAWCGLTDTVLIGLGGATGRTGFTERLILQGLYMFGREKIVWCELMSLCCGISSRFMTHHKKKFRWIIYRLFEGSMNRDEFCSFHHMILMRWKLLRYHERFLDLVIDGSNMEPHQMKKNEKYSRACHEKSVLRSTIVFVTNNRTSFCWRDQKKKQNRDLYCIVVFAILYFVIVTTAKKV